MMRELMWTPWEGPGIEHLRLLVDGDGTVADGLVVGVHAGVAFRARYGLRLDERGRAREVGVELIEPGRPGRRLRGDGEGRWRDGDGADVPELDGCVDVDLSASALTVSLPARRLGLRLGESRELRLARLVLPDLTVHAVEQRLTRTGERRLLHEALPRGLRVEVELDADGLVVDHPQRFRRATPRSGSATSPGRR